MIRYAAATHAVRLHGGLAQDLEVFELVAAEALEGERDAARDGHLPGRAPPRPDWLVTGRPGDGH